MSVDVETVEHSAAAAWPATRTEHAEGWLLRHTPGVGKRRNNAALPPPAERSPEKTIETVEAFYRALDAPVIVQVSPAERQAGLDAALAARGYRYAAPTLVLTAPAAEVAARTADRHDHLVEIADAVSPAWRDAYMATGGAGSAAVSEIVLTRIPGPAAFARLTVGGEVAAIGLFVAGAETTGVFCMATHERHRRRGYAAALLRAGARWTRTPQLYLQVEEDNLAARHLYERSGFTHSHSYHYGSPTGRYARRSRCGLEWLRGRGVARVPG